MSRTQNVPMRRWWTYRGKLFQIVHEIASICFTLMCVHVCEVLVRRNSLRELFNAKKCFEVRDVGIFLGLFIPEECGRKKKSVELFASVVVDVIKLINQVLGVHHASKIIQ